MSFEKFNLHPKLLKALEEAGYLEPTEVQFKTITKVSEGLDLRASAQTGTGKTAAFLLPAINKILTPREKPSKAPRVLILAPTRELAIQISTQVEKYGKYLQKMKVACIYGGVPYHKQLRKLARPCDLLIATPGRLIDLITQRKVNLSKVEMLILDEADRMLDMGFVEPVNQIASATPKSRQTLLFSATLEGSVMKFSNELMRNPVDVVVHAKKAKHENIQQNLHYVDNIGHKNRLLDHILNEDPIDNAIVFTSTKRHADQLVEELYDKGFSTAALHGDMSQRQRTRTISQLRNGKIKILVATDVAARGIDVQSITHVINFDLPRNIEDYVHRIGRTGRAGAKGTALSFASHRDAHLVKKIQEFTGHKMDVVERVGFEPSRKKPSTSSRPKPRPRFQNKRKPAKRKRRK
ncbi:MAG: DEAD/DEAH box helicase [Candidatus Algichlamydia australiensis]|nr:DEAD/DEAH box helicase [Chlamydiales bacterium]